MSMEQTAWKVMEKSTYVHIDLPYPQSALEESIYQLLLEGGHNQASFLADLWAGCPDSKIHLFAESKGFVFVVVLMSNFPCGNSELPSESCQL